MTTVTQGNTGTYTFAANEMVTLSLTGSQQARVEVVDASTGKVKYGATTSVSETFGPFNLSDTLSVTAVRGSVVYTISTYSIPSVGANAIARTTAQLAGTPSGADIALGANGQFYDPLQTVDATHPWVYYSATATAYVKIAGSGGGIPATAAPLALAASAAVGSSTKYMREDAVLALPTALQVAAVPQVSGTYNASTNTVLTGPLTGQNLASSTIPTGGPPAFTVTVAGTPGLDSVGALSIGDTLYQTGTVWDVIGGAQQTTLLYKGDGTTAQRLIAAVPGVDYMPAPIFKTGVPFGVMPSCTVGASGVITFGTTTPTAYPLGCWMWWSANALFSGSVAGPYWTVLPGTIGSAASSGTVYNSYITAIGATGNASQLAGTTTGATIAGGFTAPASPSTSGITGGTHTQPTATNIYFPGPTVAAGYVGANGYGTGRWFTRNNNSANAKTFSPGPVWAAINPTTQILNTTSATFWNNVDVAHQIGPFVDISAGAELAGTVNFAVSQVLNPRFNFAAGGSGNDWMVCQGLIMQLVP